MQQNDVR